jgi:hypothetical protein
MPERPIAKLRTTPQLWLFADRIVERHWYGSRTYPLDRVEAKMDGAGMQMRALTFGNTAYLSIVGPGVALTRALNGRARIKAGVQFAAQVNAAVRSS